jgi:hypothetical protein
LAYAGRTTTIKTDRSDKTEIRRCHENIRGIGVVCLKYYLSKILLKISGHQQRWPRPLPGAILIPPALLVVADCQKNGSIQISLEFHNNML